ncbi:MAG: AzlD domain-containing protein [Clostridiales bacterium]|nr:AzlD domain-containing protein [Clostridiales bacterium]
MGDRYIIMVCAVMAIVTLLLRAMPFILFDHGNKTPKWITYLGKVLPPAIMSMLVVFCLRNVDFLGGSHGIPELICVAVAMALHAWKRNTLLSIGISTVLYMIIVQNL